VSSPTSKKVLSGRELALLYQAQHQDYQEDLSFWLAQAAEAPGPILELGCGTGRVTLALAAQQHDIWGLDNDPAMLALLKENIPPSSTSHIRTFTGDFTNLKFEQTFGLIILPCNTYSTLSKSQRSATLAGIYRHLTIGGRFAVSLPNPQILADLATTEETEIEMSFPHPLSGHPVQLSSGWETADNQVIMTWNYDHLHPDGKVDRTQAATSHFLTSPTEYQQEFQAENFTLQAVYGDFDYSAYQPDSPYLIYILQKI